MRRVPLVALLVLAFVAIGSFVNSGRVHGQNSTPSGELHVSHANGQCKDNTCTPTGCAGCVQLTVNLPPGAQYQRSHCFTTANYPDDIGIHEVACTTDNAWSVFDDPVVSTTNGGGVTVTTTYHNRSHNRDRTVKLSVDWHSAQ
jgi:hypothetical protein